MRHARLVEVYALRKPAADSTHRPVSQATPLPSRRALAIQATLRTMQRKCACGGSCSACKKRAEHGDSQHRHETAQPVPSLKINPPGDRFEREADAVADQVMRTAQRGSGNALSSSPGPGLQRTCAHCEEEEQRQKVQRAETGAGPDVAPLIVHEVLRSPGQPLASGVRAFFEPRLGHDLGRIRIHADAKAAESAHAVRASAYTVGPHVVFGEGQFAPHADAGRKTLAHELAHTIQQGASPGSPDDGSRPQLQRLTLPMLQRQTDATVEAGTGVGPAITAGTMVPDRAIDKQNVRADNCFGRDGCNIDFHFDKAYVGDYNYVGGGGKTVRGVYVKISVHNAAACGPCDKIQLLQVARGITKSDGKIVTAEPDTATRKARAGWDDPDSKSRGWGVDTGESDTQPYYSKSWVGQEGSATKPAILWDTPGGWTTDTNAGLELESCAICTPNSGPSTTLACVRWGYYIDSTGNVAFRPAVPVAYCGVTQPLNDATLRWGAIAGNTPANIDFRKQPPPPPPAR